jgi:hypothetical protein
MGHGVLLLIFHYLRFLFLHFKSALRFATWVHPTADRACTTTVYPAPAQHLPRSTSSHGHTGFPISVQISPLSFYVFSHRYSVAFRSLHLRPHVQNYNSVPSYRKLGSHCAQWDPINVQMYFSLQIRSACRFLRFLFSSFLTAIPLRSVVFICVRMFKIITRFRSTENSVPIVHNGIRSTCRCISLYRSDQRADFSASFLRIFSPLFRCVP